MEKLYRNMLPAPSFCQKDVEEDVEDKGNASAG